MPSRDTPSTKEVLGLKKRESSADVPANGGPCHVFVFFFLLHVLPLRQG
jgi:hypothetical protein